MGGAVRPQDESSLAILQALLAGPSYPKGYLPAIPPDVQARGLIANLLSMRQAVPVRRGYIDPYTAGAYSRDLNGNPRVTLAGNDPYTLLHELLHHATDSDPTAVSSKYAAMAPTTPTTGPANRLHELIYRLSAPSNIRVQDKTDQQATELLTALLGQLVQARHETGIESLK